ncbi:class II fructose-bisphosphate aldolase [Chakrabartyella piscis]|uniref:class II fructose-bisphosphate aldolase n=1 Tax=Chakrabartyella piscis TaxID=2918914 RepID=UPI0029583515|nr:class II fructose-bisphosphate aldolase [Chakrabartyella piscis]
MPLVTMKEVLQEAKEKQIGCGAFSVGNMEMVKGAIAAAEALQTPIILQIAEVRLPHSPLHMIGPLMVAAAKEAKVKVAVHLDHGTTMETIEQALEIGFTSVMFDGSTLPFAENIEMTKKVVKKAQCYGATMEAELGHVGGSEDGSHNQAILYTNPEEAHIFCEETGVDALAVAIGNAHGAYTAEPKLAFDVLEEIANVVPIPLVLHGGSGITDTDFQRCISLGVHKVNIATASFHGMVQAVEGYINKEEKHNYFDLSTAMVAGVCQNVTRHIEVFGTKYSNEI